MAAPPYTDLAGYAARVTELVPDTKGGYASDADFVKDALERYAERYPCWETADVGDGTLVSWPMGTSPFAGFVIGYSDLHEILVEQLQTDGTPHRPRRTLVWERDFWLDYRTTSGVPAVHLVFRTAPAASPQVRVHFRRRWAVNDAPGPKNEVPVGHQMAIVFRAAAYKATALASAYRRSVDPSAGSDFFAALEVAEGYATDAKKWEADFERILGVGAQAHAHLTFGTVVTDVDRVFPRGQR